MGAVPIGTGVEGITLATALFSLAFSVNPDVFAIHFATHWDGPCFQAGLVVGGVDRSYRHSLPEGPSLS